MISILLLTIDRYELTKKCVGKALEEAGADYELLVCDNGSKDKRTLDYINSLKPVYFRKNFKNKGIGCMYNFLATKAKGDFICIIDNDIELPSNWLKDAVESYKENDGILGWKCVEGPNKDYVYGTKFLSKKRFDEMNGFDEKYGLYGLEDSDLNKRIVEAGYVNRYVGNSIHLGVGEHDQGEYRKMKDKALTEAWRMDTKIPRIMHRIWIGPHPKPTLIESWKEKHVDYKFMEWDNETIKTFKFKNQKHIDSFIKDECWHGAADLIRYEVLYKYGGFIVSADSECVNSIEDLLDKDSFCCYEQEDIRPKLLSPIMGTKPKNEMLKWMIEDLHARETVQNEVPWQVTGNLFFTHARIRCNYTKMEILPSYTFIPEHYTGLKYTGEGKIYAKHLFGTTNQINDRL